jgi:predicted dehydrogenase
MDMTNYVQEGDNMKVIQVGMGGMGNAWINAVNRSVDVEFVGFVEVNPDIAQAQCEQYGFNPDSVYTSLQDALDAVTADGVINVTPPQFHKPISFIAMDAGIPVLCEKPLAGTLADARAIVDKANATGVLCSITQNYRYSPVAQTVKSVLDSGKLGAIGAIDVAFYKGPHFGGFREEMPHPLIIDMSIHHFDMMRFFLDSNPSQIIARTWNPSWSWYNGDASASVNIQFQNGVPVTYTGSWCSQGLETPWNAHWRFDCANGVLSVEQDKVTIQERVDTVHEATREVPLVPMQRQAQDFSYTSSTKLSCTGSTSAHRHKITFILSNSYLG